MTDPGRRSFADGPVPRIGAVLLIIVSVATLAYMHRETLFASTEAPAASQNPQLAACLAERVGAVDKMRAEGVVNEMQYGSFRARAEAYCQQQFGNSGGGPPGMPSGLAR